MKTDKKNIKHWVYLILTTLNVIIGMVMRRNIQTRRIILYGHKFNGNIKAFYDYLLKNHKDIELFYLTMDPDDHRILSAKHNTLLSLNIKDMIKAAGAHYIITDHGPHSLCLLKKFTSIKFVDVWHGIPFKGFDQDDFKSHHDYNQVWVSSPSMKKIYKSSYGFDEKTIKVTGYARTDPLINHSYNKVELLKKYGLQGFEKVILIAPTWQHDEKGRSIIPFNIQFDAFFEELNKAANAHNALVVFRAHLNSKEVSMLQSLSNVKIMSYQKYPQTEEFLYVSDILVSDWSSIVFDFLVLRRPTVFLDVPAPFAKGFSYGPEYRFGEIASDFPSFTKAIHQYIKAPGSFTEKYKTKMEKVSREVYGEYADGKAAERYFNNLLVN